MKLLDRYILSRFLGILATTLLAFLSLFLIVDVVENLDKFIDAKMPREAVMAYYLYTIPWFLSIGLPMATLIATFFAMGLLNKRNEITAMKASGLSVMRIGTSLLLAGMVISILSFFFDDIIVSEGNQRKAHLQSQFLSREYRRQHKVRKQDIFLQQSPTEVLAIDRYDYREQQANGAYFQRYENGKLTERVDFTVLKWDDARNVWLGEGYHYRWFQGDSTHTLAGEADSDTLLALAITPFDLTRMSVTPEEMRYGELREFVARLISNGIDPSKWEVNMHFKVAFACTSFIMVLFGLPLSVGGRPNRSMAFGAGMAIFVIFGYYVAIKLGQSLGIKGVLAPLAAVWLPNLLFILLGGFLLLRVRS